MIVERIVEVQEFYTELLSENLNLESTDFFETNDDKRNFAHSKKELKEQWDKWLRYRIMVRVQIDLNDNPNTTFDAAVAEAIQKEKKYHEDWFKRLLQTTTEDRFSNYVNAITSIYDPHTGYFPPEEKENFDISMSGRLEGIGARLQTENGYVKVTDIIPGSASWRQGSLEENDLILAVAQDRGEYVDVVDMKLNEVVKLIRGRQGTPVKLKVQKVDGRVVDITIVRDVVILEEGYAKSALLTNPSTNGKIGYIKLPKFYTDFSNTGGRTCSKDIKEELRILKSNNVEGIILDLRDNGGGSLRDVVEIGGFFIEQGPMVQVKHQKEEPSILEDNNKSVEYDGPLLILVNNFSASASEILAAAMQDYKRALIVGTTTFGKGTVQRFVDLDRTVFGNDEVKPLGSVKLTIQKFYRANGGTNQLVGVIPDVVLPDIYSKIDIGEKENDFPLSWSEVKPVEHSQNIYTVSDIESLKLSSGYRIDTNSVFITIEKRADLLSEQKNNSHRMLNYTKYTNNLEQVDSNSKALEDLLEIDRKLIQVENTVTINESDKEKIELRDRWFSTIRKDVYIEESINILNDLITTKITSNSKK